MPLLKNTFQPYFPDPDSPAPKSCNGTYCYPVASGDVVRQQFYQTPCDESLVEDPTFNDISLGAELVTNGTFETNADGWFVAGVEIASTTCPTTVDGWCYDSVNDNIGHDGTAGETEQVYQTGLGLVSGNIYKVTYTVEGASQGWVHSRLGENIGSVSGVLTYDNGTVTDYLYYTDAQDIVSFHISADFDGSITDISVQQVTISTWTGDEWVFEGGYACVPTGAAIPSNLYNTVSDYIFDGEYYVVSVTVSSYTSGTLSVYVDDGTGASATNPQAAISSDGTFTYYFTAAQDGVIGFAPSSSFVGCITNPTVQKLRLDYPFELVDSSGNTVDVSEFATYVNDKVLLNLDFADMLEAGTIDDYGCYNIQITDSCLVSGDNLVVDGDFANGDFSDWLRNNGSYQYDMTGGYLEFIYEPLEGSNLLANGDFSSGTTGWTGFGTDWTESGDATHVPGNTTVLSHAVTITVPPPMPIIRKYYVQFTISGRTAGSVAVNLSNGTPRTFSTNEVITVEISNITTGGSVNITFTPSSTFDGTIDDIAVHESDRIWSSYATVQNLINPLIVAANYEAEVEVTQITGTGNIGAAAYIVGQTTPITYEYTVGTHQYSIPNYVPGGQRMAIIGRFELNGNTYPGRIRVDNASLVSVEPFEATYVSECLNFQLSHQGTTLVTAWCDQNAFDLDFEDTEYLLQMRIECRSLNATVPKEGVGAKDSKGNASLKYAQLEKQWIFVTGYISESASTTLAAMCSCDHFTIGESGEDATEYFAEIEDFVPQWRAAGDYNLAPAVLSIRKKIGGMKFNRHT